MNKRLIRCVTNGIITTRDDEAQYRDETSQGRVEPEPRYPDRFAVWGATSGVRIVVYGLDLFGAGYQTPIV